MKELLLATNNPGKIAEMSSMLTSLRVAVIGLGDLTTFTEVPETGETFRDNARIKAMGYALQSGKIALADDSGLEVKALDGRPGVFSARYGGDHLNFDEKMQLILNELDQLGDPDRSARFVSSIVIATPSSEILFEADGFCSGRIALQPRGVGGFGYDPIFEPDGFDLTFGELDSAIKHRISHRAAAFRQIIPFLRDFDALRLDQPTLDA